MILKSSILVTSLTVFAAFMSFVSQLIIAGFFGISENVDAYLIAVSIPTLVSGTIIAALSYTVVPSLVFYNLNQKKYCQFCGAMLLGIVVLSCCVVIAGFFSSPFFVQLLGSTLSSSAFDIAVMMSYVSWISGGLAIISAYLAAMHNSIKCFVTPVLIGIFPVIGVICFTTIFGKYLNVVSIVWGTFVGTVLSMILLLCGVYKYIEISRNSFTYMYKIARYFSIMPLVIISMFCFTIYQPIDAYWAPQLGSGNLASLGYCQRIIVGLGQFIIAGPSIVIMPRLTEAYRDCRYMDFFNVFARVLRTVLAFAVPLAVTLSILALPLLKVLFQRGAFNAAATNEVAGLLPFMTAGMVAMLCVVMIFRAFFSKKDFFAVVFLSVLMIILYFVLSGVLSSVLGVKGIGLAYTFSWWIILPLAIYFLWRQNLDLVLQRENFVFLLQLFIVNVYDFIVVGLVG